MLDETTVINTRVTGGVDRRWWLALGAILIASAAARLPFLDLHPGWEWDEPVYTSIGSSLANGTGLRSAPLLGDPGEHYIYHPPFYFLLLGGWFKVFGSGIDQARYLNVLASLVYVTLFAVAMRRFAGPKAGLIAAALLSFDAWLIFENRVSWLENTLMIFIALTLLAWESALRKQTDAAWVLLGVSIGAAVVYKHIGAVAVSSAVVAFVLLWKRLERPRRAVLITAAAIAAVIVLYFAGMALAFPDEFLRQSLGQLLRTFGFRESRGTIGVNPGAVVAAVFSHYWIYAGTGLAVLAALVLGVRRGLRVRRHEDSWRGLQIPFAMTIGSALPLAIISLKFPHYFILVFVPALLYVAGEAALALDVIDRRRIAVIGVAALMVLGVTGATLRLTASTDTDTMKDAAAWLSSHSASSDVVVTEEPISLIVDREHCRANKAQLCSADWQWLITYTSATQALSDNPAFEEMVASSVQCTTFVGFKEEVIVWARSTGPADQLRSC